MSVPAWLASGRATPDRVRARLVRALDRPNRSGAFGRALAAHLGSDLDALYAEHHPRKAAECRARGDHPQADKLHAALIALMFCANCGRPLTDPVSIDRGIGPDCWEMIDPARRVAIDARTGRSEDETSSGVQRVVSYTCAVSRVVHVPYTIDQDEDGVWCASAQLRPGVGAVGDGPTKDAAIDDLRDALAVLIDEVGPPPELTLTLDVA